METLGSWINASKRPPVPVEAFLALGLQSHVQANVQRIKVGSVCSNVYL